jgi:hypothetical protein
MPDTEVVVEPRHYTVQEAARILNLSPWSLLHAVVSAEPISTPRSTVAIQNAKRY